VINIEEKIPVRNVLRSPVPYLVYWTILPRNADEKFVVVVDGGGGGGGGGGGKKLVSVAFLPHTCFVS
jgi:hypothetical protein